MARWRGGGVAVAWARAGAPPFARAEVRVAGPCTRHLARAKRPAVLHSRRSVGRRALHPPSGAGEASRGCSPAPKCGSPGLAPAIWRGRSVPRFFARAEVWVAGPCTRHMARAKRPAVVRPRRSVGRQAMHPPYGAGEASRGCSPAPKCGSPGHALAIWRGRSVPRLFARVEVRVAGPCTRHLARAKRPAVLRPRRSAGRRALHPPYGASEASRGSSLASKCGSNGPAPERGRTRRATPRRRGRRTPNPGG